MADDNLNIIGLLNLIYQRIKNKKRLYRLKRYSDSFWSDDCIDVLQRERIARTSEEALSIGNELVKAELIRGLPDSKFTSKKKLFYLTNHGRLSILAHQTARLLRVLLSLAVVLAEKKQCTFQDVLTKTLTPEEVTEALHAVRMFDNPEQELYCARELVFVGLLVFSSSKPFDVKVKGATCTFSPLAKAAVGHDAYLITSRPGSLPVQPFVPCAPTRCIDSTTHTFPPLLLDMELLPLFVRLYEGIHIADRSYQLKTFPFSFLFKDCVKFLKGLLQEKKEAGEYSGSASQDEAFAIARLLVFFGLVRPASPEPVTLSLTDDVMPWQFSRLTHMLVVPNCAMVTGIYTRDLASLTIVDVLQHPRFRHAYYQYCRDKRMEENVICWEDMDKFKVVEMYGTLDLCRKYARRIFSTHLAKGSDHNVTISDETCRILEDALSRGQCSADVFDRSIRMVLEPMALVLQDFLASEYTTQFMKGLPVLNDDGSVEAKNAQPSNTSCSEPTSILDEDDMSESLPSEFDEADTPAYVRSDSTFSVETPAAESSSSSSSGSIMRRGTGPILNTSSGPPTPPTGRVNDAPAKNLPAISNTVVAGIYMSYTLSDVLRHPVAAEICFLNTRNVLIGHLILLWTGLQRAKELLPIAQDETMARLRLLCQQYLDESISEHWIPFETTNPAAAAASADLVRKVKLGFVDSDAIEALQEHTLVLLNTTSFLDDLIYNNRELFRYLLDEGFCWTSLWLKASDTVLVRKKDIRNPDSGDRVFSTAHPRVAPQRPLQLPSRPRIRGTRNMRFQPAKSQPRQQTANQPQQMSELKVMLQDESLRLAMCAAMNSLNEAMPVPLEQIASVCEMEEAILYDIMQKMEGLKLVENKGTFEEPAYVSLTGSFVFE